MKRRVVALLALPFVLGAVMWPVARHRRHQLEVQRATHELILVLGEGNANPRKVQLLLNQGARLNARDADENCPETFGYTPLHLAAAFQNSAIVRLVLSHDVDVEARSADGKTPLICAVKSGKFASVQMLLAKGAKLQTRDKKGYTPLLWAATQSIPQQNERLVALLLRRGAKANDKNNDGMTALQMADCEGAPLASAQENATSRRVKRLLRVAGAK